MNAPSILDASRTFGQALEASGYKGDKAVRLSRDNALCMFETHIEQGPILEDAGNEIGVVDLSLIHISCRRIYRSWFRRKL